MSLQTKEVTNKEMNDLKLEMLVERIKRKANLGNSISALGVIKGSIVVFDMLYSELKEKYKDVSKLSDKDLEDVPYVSKSVTFDDYEEVANIGNAHPYGMELDEYLGTRDLTSRKPKNSPETSQGIYRYEFMSNSMTNYLKDKGLCVKGNHIYYSTDVLSMIAESYGFNVKFSDIRKRLIPELGEVIPKTLGGRKGIEGLGYVENSYSIDLKLLDNDKDYKNTGELDKEIERIARQK